MALYRMIFGTLGGGGEASEPAVDTETGELLD